MNLSDVEPVAVEGRIRIPYRWPAGRVGGRFLSALRDQGRILGLRCPQCRHVAVPPRPRCLACRVPSDDWVAVGPEGEVVSWTVARGSAPPRTWVLVRLDGADTALAHVLLDTDPASVRCGLRVRAVLADPRAGQITDIAGFRPAAGGDACAR